MQHIIELAQIIKREKLVSLSDNEYTYKDLNVLLLSTSSIENRNNAFHRFHKVKNVWDLVNCNNDLKLFTAHLFFYRPLINNPIEEAFFLDGKFNSVYDQTSSDWLYSSFVSCCYEKLYNFWDRIGDSLAYYLNVDIKEEQVNFPKVIDILNKNELLKENIYFNKLLDFKNNEFKEFNKHRKDIVHYYQFETTFRFEHAINSGNKAKIEELWNWKRRMPEYFSEHLKISCEGYYNTYKLINNLP
nr:Cthe_2314 family HEPN domain-containing protein [uncultured Carboxylicivirga sp.]